MTTFYSLSLLPVKLLAYSLWAYCGFSYLKLYFQNPKLKALLYGLLRLLIGLLLAMPVAFMAYQLYDFNKPILSGLIAYLIVYIPMRWFEWGLLDCTMNAKARSFDYFIFGRNQSARRWRIGGLMISLLLDGLGIAVFHGLDVTHAGVG